MSLHCPSLWQTISRSVNPVPCTFIDERGALCHCNLPSLYHSFTVSSAMADSNSLSTSPFPYKFVFCKDSFLRFLYSSAFLFILRPSPPSHGHPSPPYKYIFLAPQIFLFFSFLHRPHTHTHAHLPAITTIMADRQDPNRPQRPPTSLPPQPSQLIDNNLNFTPYYMTDEEARRFPGHATPYLSNSLRHPPEEFPSPRNKFPGSDPIMDARKEVCGILLVSFSVVRMLMSMGAGW